MSASDRRRAPTAPGVCDTSPHPGLGAPSATPAAPGRESPDLRLLPLVGSLWLGLAVVQSVPPARPMPWAVGSVAGLAIVLGGAAVLVRRGPGPPTGAGRRGRIVLLLLCGALLGSSAGALHMMRLRPPVVVAAVDAAAVVQVEASVIGDPVARLPTDAGERRAGPQWSLAVRVTSLTVRGRQHTLRVPALLRGPQVEHLRYGARVALAGRAQAPWVRHVQSLELRVLAEVTQLSPPGAVARTTTRIRAAFRDVCAGLPRDAAALLLGLAVGDESLVSPELDAAMIRSGLAHLTAVSGSNTSLVVAITMAGVVTLGLGWRVRVLISLAVLCGYVLLVRPEPSVLRASVMGVVALVALATGGRRRGPPALLAAALLLLLVLPAFALSIGFALSFAATAGLLVVGPPITERLGRWKATWWLPEPIRLALAVAASAHMATLPLVVLMGNGASLVALPANVLAMPLVPFATVLGLGAALIAPVAPTAGVLAATVASPATGAIAWIAHRSATLPFGVIDVGAGPAGALSIAAGLGLLALAAVRGWRPHRHPRLIVVLALSLALGWATARLQPGSWPPPDWVVLACDVGQGDGLLVREPGSAEALLVDAGPDGRSVTRCLRDAGVERLTVLITHFHADHFEGLAAVLANWPVDEILSTPVPEPAHAASAVVRAADIADVPIRTVRAGQRTTAGGVPLAILWPSRRMIEAPVNNASVVALAAVHTTQGPIRVLLTGDIEPEVQAVLLGRAPPEAAIVKVPHHGSRHQLEDFAGWSGARIALISVGTDNDHGHPSATTVDQYRRAGALVGRTDHRGDMAVTVTAGALALRSRR